MAGYAISFPIILLSIPGKAVAILSRFGNTTNEDSAINIQGHGLIT